MESRLDPVRNASSLFLKVLSWTHFLAPLLTRLLVGYAFYLAGKGKVGNLENVTEFFTSLSIPFPAANAWFVSHLEYLGGLLLIVGLATRPIALLLGSTMIVALLTADRADFLMAWSGAGDKGLVDLTPVAYGTFLLWLATYGPGVLSVDKIISKYLGLGDSVHRRLPDEHTSQAGAVEAVA